MDQNFQTSFIPKKPMVEERVVAPRQVSLLTILSIFIFFTIVVASGGLYLYKSVLTKNIISMQAELEIAKGRFEPAAITKLQELDKRLRSAKVILVSHVAISPIFDTFQNLTLKTIRYTKFGYDIGTDQKINIKMSGQSVGYGTNTGYKAIALQEDLFTKDKNIINPVFSNLSLNDKGIVFFDLDFSVDSNFLSYKENLLTNTNSTSTTAPVSGITN